MNPRAAGLLGALAASCCALVGCEPSSAPLPDPAASATAVFRTVECNGVTDADVTDVVGSTLFTRVVNNDAGGFWQENTAIADVGLGTGISTWWYRGSDVDAERTLERRAGRTVTELSVNGNTAFTAYDDKTCSVYVAKGSDVITWSVQTLNPGMLPDLCSITDRLAQLSQDRVN